jgi:hypothetical protein
MPCESDAVIGEGSLAAGDQIREVRDLWDEVCLWREVGDGEGAELDYDRAGSWGGVAFTGLER